LCFRFKQALFPPVEADAGVVPNNDLAKEEPDDDNLEGQAVDHHRRRPKKEKVGFRDRKVYVDKRVVFSVDFYRFELCTPFNLLTESFVPQKYQIIEYENRIRTFSTPEKVFRYFATVRIVTSETTEVYMTPDDFLRAITPGMKQPDGKGS
jgi:calcium uptake protein 1, mitochondrial